MKQTITKVEIDNVGKFKFYFDYVNIPFDLSEFPLDSELRERMENIIFEMQELQE